MSERDTILALIKDGPVPTRSLRGRKGVFWLAYRQLLSEGLIVEFGSGTKQEPRYVGLPEASFPERRPTVKAADVRLLVASGFTREQAKERLREAINAGGTLAVASLCEAASNKLLERGINPYRLKRKPGRPIKDVLPEVRL